jgi:hypothetical protein
MTMKLKAVLIPVPELDPAIALLQNELGLALKFRDGQRYAAFEAVPMNLTLACEQERIVQRPALVIEVVDDIHNLVERLVNAGVALRHPLEQGPHEWRAVLEPAQSCFQLVISQKLQGA